MENWFRSKWLYLGTLFQIAGEKHPLLDDIWLWLHYIIAHSGVNDILFVLISFNLNFVSQEDEADVALWVTTFPSPPLATAFAIREASRKAGGNCKNLSVDFVGWHCESRKMESHCVHVSGFLAQLPWGLGRIQEKTVFHTEARSPVQLHRRCEFSLYWTLWFLPSQGILRVVTILEVLVEAIEQRLKPSDRRYSPESWWSKAWRMGLLDSNSAGGYKMAARKLQDS